MICLGHASTISWCSNEKHHTCDQIGTTTNCSHCPHLDFHPAQQFHYALPVSYLFHSLKRLPQSCAFFIFSLHSRLISVPPPSQRQQKLSGRKSFSFLLSITMEEIPLFSLRTQNPMPLLSQGLHSLNYSALPSLFIPGLSPLILSHQHLKYLLLSHSEHPPSTLALLQLPTGVSLCLHPLTAHSSLNLLQSSFCLHYCTEIALISHR